MADLLSVLGNAASSLDAARGAAATASNNLENVNTVGYSRQTAIIQEQPAYQVGGAFLGGGSTLYTVTQTRDRFVESQLPLALGNSASSTAQSNALAAVDALDPNSDTGVAASLGNFYSALRALSQNPGDASLRQTAVAAAQSLATSFNQASSEISSAQSGIDSQISTDLPQVNTLAKQIATLNTQIAQAKASGASPNDLLDARQQAQDTLVGLTGATPIQDSQGNVNLALSDGSALVSGGFAAQLSAVSDPTTGHLALRLTHTDGSGPTSVKVSSGTIGGLLTARDGALAQASSGLDQLASGVASSINAIHETGYAEDGSTGRDLFVVPTTGSAAAGISINAQIASDPTLLAAAGSATAASGDGTALQGMVNSETALLPSGQTAEGAAASLTSSFGVAQSTAKAMSDHDASLSSNLTTLRASASGVSVDEETINLTQAQQGYQAIAKVITAANACFDALFGIT